MEEIFGNIRQVVDNPLTPEQLAEIQKELDELMTHAENQTGDVIVILFEEIFETSSPVNDDLDEYRYN